MINKKFMSKAMLMPIVCITISTSMLNTVSAMEIDNIDCEVEYEVSLNNHKENKKIIIEQGAKPTGALIKTDGLGGK